LELKEGEIAMENPQRTQGYLAFLLHAHLPFVRNTSLDFRLEEHWLFEALTESYLPLLLGWEQLARERVAFSLTLSLSPTLISMLVDQALPERYGRYLERLKELAGREVERTAKTVDFNVISRFYYERVAAIAATFNSVYRGDLIQPLKKLAQAGHLELLTTCATHGYLPLILTEEARRAQIRVGIELFRETFGWRPTGLWLPECGYLPGIERLLRAEGIEYFIMSGHGFTAAVPAPETSVYAPVRTGGVAVFGRDYETSQQVWSRSEGYPGDYDYREFYRDIGYDLDYEYIAPYLTAGIRGATGLKYYRITGKTERKEPYNPARACAKAAEHARDFIAKRVRQVAYWAERMAGQPIITAPYDAELFGHWWFEGPDWLTGVLRLAGAEDCPVKTSGFSGYLHQYPPTGQAAFAHSSWGEGGYSRYWLNSGNDWIYPYCHRAEKLMGRLTELLPNPAPLQKAALNQAGRELLLAQSSDWPFILTSRTTVKYAQERLRDHLSNFYRICRDLKAGTLDAAWLQQLTEANRIFPQFDYKVYQPQQTCFAAARRTFRADRPVVLMLAWEFPPRYVGGLGIHVRDLARALACLGWNIQVLTASPNDAPTFRVLQGVGVHYIPTGQTLEGNPDFLAGMLQLNLALADYGRKLAFGLQQPVIVHAHDWLVTYAARELRTMLRASLVTTIHATEFGRNNGIHTPMQTAIHQLEVDLAQNSERLICCSRYMKNEIQRLFQPAAGCLRVIPNGVRPIKLPERADANQDLLYVGRLVIEKGVQHLILALPGLIGLFPRVKLIIAGTGPYQDELRQLVTKLQLQERVEFAGFVDESRRNRLLANCRVAVFPSLYEPFGLVALEAMAAGTPVVVSRIGGLVETVPDETVGLSFPPGDVGALRNCLIRVLQNPEWAAAMARRAKAKVARDYSWATAARRTAEVYRRELAGRGVEKEY
jgi:1,4-alpha-glucan branching enzyme